jgi:hypothetical protein
MRLLLPALVLLTACDPTPPPSPGGESQRGLFGGSDGAYGDGGPVSERRRSIEAAWAKLRWLSPHEAAHFELATPKNLWFDSRPASDPAAAQLFSELSKLALARHEEWIAVFSAPSQLAEVEGPTAPRAIDAGALRDALHVPDRPVLVRLGPAPLYEQSLIELERLEDELRTTLRGEEARSVLAERSPPSWDQARRSLGKWIREHLGELFALAFALTRLLGVQIETGWVGVLFRFGRANKILQPGFHPLIPWVWSVRKLRARAMTFDFPAQRVSNCEGLVYHVDTNLVIRIEDPIKALVEIHDLSAGCALAVLTSTQSIILQATRDELQSPGLLDAQLASDLMNRVARWGITIDHAGFTSISPAPQSLALIQQEARRTTRAEILTHYQASGMPLSDSLGLIGRARAESGPKRRRPRQSRGRQSLLTGKRPRPA